ncbi:hypothetical protein PC128_g6589 [Phytophthora cactorum]|nr:hypothetical protein PC128_g6589 [Phytophthora cactorum]
MWLKSAPEYTMYISGLADPLVQAKILDLIENRWKFISPPSNSTKIAYLLDPSKDTSLFTGDSLRDTVADAVELARRFGLPPDVSPASFRLELLDFIERKKSWSVEQREKAAADPPLHWWLLDQDFPHLYSFAERVLSIPTSSAASERLWSIHGFTHSKLRNSLRVVTVEKLSFIYTNNGDTKPTSMPLYKTPTRPNDSDFDSESDDDNEREDDESLFDFNDASFEYLLDAIVSVDTASRRD